MAYLNLKNSLRERCEKSNNLFKKIDYIFVFLFFRYAMNCRLRRQENREKLESQVRFFYLPYIITLMHEKFGGKSLFRNFFSHIVTCKKLNSSLTRHYNVHSDFIF